MKKILLLGSSGFIGSNLKEFLVNKNYDIDIPTHEELDVLYEENVYFYLKKNKYDIIINALDGGSIDNNYFENRFRMFQNLAVHNDLYERMIYFGSGAEYGRELPIRKIKENQINRINPIDTYGFCLQQMNNCARNSRNIYNFRLFGIFGKYECWQRRFISNAICKVICGYPITIRQNRVMDYLYIDDLCKIVEWAINDKPIYHDYNVVSGKEYSLYNLAKIVKKVMKSEVPIFIAKAGELDAYTANNERILKELQNYKFEDIEISIEKLSEWYKNNRQIIIKENLLYQ